MSFDIPKQGWAAVVVNEGPDFTVEVQKVDVPEPKDHELLVKLNVTGLCMTDVHMMMNDWDSPSMSQMGVRCVGHEGAGIVVKVGVRCQDSWKVGDRVGIKPVLDVCHNCEQCWNARENYCAKALHTGMHSNGTYQQYLVTPALYTSRIPDGVPDEVAGPIMCSASTMHRSLIDSGLKPGDWVVFPGGGGGVGIQGIQLAKMSTPEKDFVEARLPEQRHIQLSHGLGNGVEYEPAMGMRPIAIDGGEPKRNLCLSMGAEAFVDFRDTADVASEVIRIADGIGAHGIFVTAYQAYKDSIKFAGHRIGAKIMCIALPPAGEVQFASDPTILVLKNLTVIGTFVGTMQDTSACLDYARRGLLKGVAEVRGRSKWAESVQQLKTGQVAGRIVMDFNQD